MVRYIFSQGAIRVERISDLSHDKPAIPLRHTVLFVPACFADLVRPHEQQPAQEDEIHDER